MRNREVPHVLVVPEDDANRQIANGFVDHPDVSKAHIQVLQPLGGWLKVKQSLADRQLAGLRTYPNRLLVLIIDYDGIDTGTRFSDVQAAVPEEFRHRVFILGARTDPEQLKRSTPGRPSLEKIGRALAEDCLAGTQSTWSQPELDCNLGELERMRATVGPCLFPEQET